MNSFHSSPLIQDRLSSRLCRKSRRVSKPRLSRQHELLIANPFRQGEQQNYLPMDLKNQLEQLDFISPNQLQRARRSSLFAKHLQAMQNAAKKQQEMYHFFMGVHGEKRENSETEAMEEEQPMTIEEEDGLSMSMQHCFLMMDNDHEQDGLTFLTPTIENDQIIFYSQHEIEQERGQDDFEAYFDV